jgi:glucans biosynthesis protein C
MHPRRHDIDALRAIAFALVILYHVGMYYVAGWDWHLKSPHAAQWLQVPMRALNLWRMDLVFVVSGLAFAFLARGRTSRELLASRSARLLLPLAFGMAVVVPLQPYLEMRAKGLIEAGFVDFLARYFRGGPWPQGAFPGSDIGITWNHLWYLPYLWLYTAVLLALRPVLESPPGRRLREAFVGLRGVRLVALPLLPIAAASLLLWPHFPPTHDLVHDAWLHAVYFTLFLYGFWIAADAGLWRELERLRWKLLAAAGVLLAAYFTARAVAAGPTPSPLPLRLAVRLLGDAYLWTAILALLGWAHRKLNRPWPWLAWANESVYPWYVLHQTWIVGLAFALAAWRLPMGLEAALLLAGTVAGCLVVTEAVRRVNVLRPLFGLRRRPAPPRCPSPARPAHRSAHNA